MQIHSYHNTLNIGDAIQTVALKRLIGDCDYTDRDKPSSGPIIVNGWLGNSWLSGDENAIYAGVHLAERSIERMAQLKPKLVGSRDLATHEKLLKIGSNSELVGCATITLERYEGPRQGIVAVDFDKAPARARKLSHYIIGPLTWKQQLHKAEQLLELYRTSETVLTTRLHVALPCLAMGTKVYLGNLDDPRFTILEMMGLKPGWLEGDVSEWSARYKNFLTNQLKTCNIK